ncbi:hypothetical protein OROGR_031006 [Orobanche gracilis]
MRILSQTSSSSGCECNWSVFDRIHTKKRNKLEHQSLNDLVFVHYNLRLQDRGKDHMKMFDPLDYECIDMVDSWIVDDEECEDEGELVLHIKPMETSVVGTLITCPARDMDMNDGQNVENADL